MGRWGCMLQTGNLTPSLSAQRVAAGSAPQERDAYPQLAEGSSDSGGASEKGRIRFRVSAAVCRIQ